MTEQESAFRRGQHVEIEPAILYVGTPVVLVSTRNADGGHNVAPMSSAWWLGWSCMLGFDASSHTVENLRRTGRCVLNLPSADLVAHVDRLAKTTGSATLPFHKEAMGYQHVADKLALAGLSAAEGESDTPARVVECPLVLEGELVEVRDFAVRDPRMLIAAVSAEVRITRVLAHRSILSTEYRNRIDPRAWNPLLMSFLDYFERGQQVQPSRLREMDEEWYAGRLPERVVTP